MDGLERSFVDLAKELRAGGQLPGSPAQAAATSATSAAPGGGAAAVPSAAATGGVTVAGPGGVVASAGPMGAPLRIGCWLAALHPWPSGPAAPLEPLSHGAATDH
jgi:hypothetical protein